MDEYIDAIISVIKAENLDPADCEKDKKILSECALGSKLIRVYMSNAPRFRDLTYSYERS